MIARPDIQNVDPVPAGFDLQRFATATTTPRGTTPTLGLVDGRAKVDMKDKILLLEPDAAPLVVLTGKLGKVQAIQPRHEWPTDTLIERWTKVNGALNNSVTTWTLDDTAHITPHDVILVPTTGETVLVLTVPSSTSITVTRSLGPTAAASIADNADVVVVGNTKQESADASQMNMKAEVIQHNFAQLMDTTYGVSGTMEWTQTYGGPDLPYLRMKRGIEHKIKLEMAMWFGERSEDTTTGRRTMRGIDNWITTHRTDAGGTLTEAALEQWTEDLFRYGRKREKWAFCAARAISVINQFGAGKLTQTFTDKTTGITVTQYRSGHGTLNLVKHHLFENSFNERIYGLDIEDIKMVVGRDVQIIKDIQDNKNDSKREQYLSETTLELGNEELHAVLTNITG